MGYIFETEIEQIKNVVRARTIGEAESITLRDILGSRTHPAIKAYFRAEVERSLRKERQLETRSKRFPYSIPEVISLQHQEDLLLISHYQFNQDEFDTLLDQAVHFTFNFLCRPQFTLVEFLFENQRRMSISSIEQKLEYCVDYEYYALLLKRYFADRGLTEISYEEFKNLLKKIDDEVVSRHTSRELADMTKTIMSFVDAIQDERRMGGKTGALPINAAIVFFEDKNLPEIKLRLEYERDHNRLTEIELSQLAKIIEDVRTITSDHPIGRVVATLDEIDHSSAPESPFQVSIASATKEDAKQVVPEQTVTADQENPVEAAGKQEPAGIVGQSEDSETDHHAPIASMLSRSEEKKILKSIFHKDRDEFGSTLRALDRAGTWEEASLILDDLFLARDVSPQSAVAILLTEKTFERYRSTRH